MSRRNGALTPPAEIAPSGQAISTPFLRAKQVWDDRTGALLAQKANWQRMALVLTGAVILLTAALLLRPERTRLVPYIVEVAETGQVRTVGILPQPWQGQLNGPVLSHTQFWLEWVREVPSDEPALYKYWSHVEDFTTQKCLTMMSAHRQQQHKRLKQGQVVTITFKNMLPIGGHSRTHQLEWVEQIVNQQGTVISREDWQATVTIAVYPPEQIKDVKGMRNPLGIFIEEVHWGQRAREKGSTP